MILVRCLGCIAIVTSRADETGTCKCVRRAKPGESEQSHVPCSDWIDRRFHKSVTGERESIDVVLGENVSGGSTGQGILSRVLCKSDSNSKGG
jgi:hypothetical protein